MKSFKQYISESSDSYGPIKLKRTPHTHAPGDREVKIKTQNGMLRISFWAEEGDEHELEFSVNNKATVSDQDDAEKIYSTVLNAVDLFLKKVKPLTLEYEGDKEFIARLKKFAGTNKMMNVDKLSGKKIILKSPKPYNLR